MKELHNKINYYSWVNKVIDVCVYVFTILAFLSICYVFVDNLFTKNKIIIMFALATIFLVSFFLLKRKITSLMNIFINRISRLSKLKLLFIVLIVIIILRIVYSNFYYFNSVGLGGDIDTYIETADDILTTGKTTTIHNVSNMLAFSAQLAFFRKIGFSYSSTIFIFFLLGTIINYLSFSSIIGKNKSFLITISYLLMPSTMIWTFCITHELALYFYLSLSFYLLTKITLSKTIKEKVIYIMLLLIVLNIGYAVSPMMNVIYIILFIYILLTNIKLILKPLLIALLGLSFMLSSTISNSTEIFISPRKLNQKGWLHTFICGSNVENYGRFITYDEERIKEYLEQNNLESTYENIRPIQEEMLRNQYEYLFHNPNELIRLLSNKFYIAWSGNYYPIEMAEIYQNQNGEYSKALINKTMMGIGTLIYLFYILGYLFMHQNKKNLALSNYKLLLLGAMGSLLLTEIMNKYTSYMMIFILFIVVSELKLDE